MSAGDPLTDPVGHIMLAATAAMKSATIERVVVITKDSMRYVLTPVNDHENTNILTFKEFHERRWRAACGILVVEIEDSGIDPTNDRRFRWYVSPDNEDKNDERAYREGYSATLTRAKAAASAACREIAVTILDLV